MRACLPVLLVTTPAIAAVSVHSDGSCIDALAATTELTRVIDPYLDASGARPTVSIRVAGEGEARRIELEVLLPDGEPGLVRSYELAPNDCASAVALLAAVLERYLADLPAARWARASAPEPGLGITARFAAGARLPLGVDCEGGVEVALGSFAFGASARLAWPWPYAGGRVLDAGLLLHAGAGWDWTRGRFAAEIAGGVVAVRGWGYREARGSFRPLLEARAAALLDIAGVRLGPFAAYAPWPVVVFAEGAPGSRALGSLRLGVALTNG